MIKREKIHSLELCDISHKFENGRELFKNVRMNFPMNKIVWLRGDSGSGKSVLIKMLNGLIAPTQGEYRINGQPVSQMSFEEFLPYRLNIGYSFDFGGLIHNRDISSNLQLPLEYHNFYTPTDAAAHVSEYMKVFNLDKVAHERPSALVGGLRKAACVARAFVSEPQLLLLDDPTTGLRGDVVNRLCDLILQKRKEGHIQHVVIATDNAHFMEGLNPVVIEVEDSQLRMNDLNLEKTKGKVA